MTEQSSDYQRGYAAGLRAEGRREGERDRQHQRHMARYALAAAVAPSVLGAGWTQGGKPLSSPDGKASVIADIVIAVEKRLG